MLSFLCALRKVKHFKRNLFLQWMQALLVDQSLPNILTKAVFHKFVKFNSFLWPSRHEIVLKFTVNTIKRCKIQQFSADLEHQVIRSSISRLCLLSLHSRQDQRTFISKFERKLMRLKSIIKNLTFFFVCFCIMTYYLLITVAICQI